MPLLNFLVQSEVQIGVEIARMLEAKPQPTTVILVSAWVSRQTLLRLRPAILGLKKARVKLRVVLGLDLGGTSREALLELNSWQIDTCLVKNNRGGSTFHPKLFLIERPETADVFIGSSNLTEGGFFTNYESVCHLAFDLVNERVAYEELRRQFYRFLEPSGPTSRQLDGELLEILVERGDVPTEQELRNLRREASRRRRRAGSLSESPFGIEEIPSPPTLPAEVLEALIHETKARRRFSTPIFPTSFYMTLPKMRGENIPGEARIPLAARDLAADFWGWPAHYTRDRNPRGGARREYWNWKPKWRIRLAEHSPTLGHISEVRMYEYSNSSDFRFYSKALLDLGANEGDVVRVTRVHEDDADFECALARRGTPFYEAWIRNCTQKVRNSDRRYGYA